MRERRVDFFAFHLPKRLFAFLGEDHGDRLSFFADQHVVDVDESRVQQLGDHATDRALAGARQSDKHNVPFHDAASLGVRARTCARYPSTLRFVSLSASPPNFSSRASVSTIAIIASAMTPIAGTAVTSERSDCGCAGLPVLRATVLSGDIRVEIGVIATRTTSGSPVLKPPPAAP